MPTFTADWFSAYIPVWKRVLAGFMDKKVRVLEIGSFEGKATTWLLENIPECTVYANDVFEETKEYKGYGFGDFNYYDRFVENIEPYKDRVKVLRGYSFYVAVDLIKNSESFHIIYIDGSHQSVNVLQDMVLCWELLKDNGVMICDDYNWDRIPNNPRVAIDAFLEVYKGKYEILEKNGQVALKKVI